MATALAGAAARNTRLIFEAEVAALLDQLLRLRIRRQNLFVEPGDLREHLKVAEGLHSKGAASALHAVAGSQPGVIQLAVSRIAINHVVRIGMKRVLEKKTLLGLGQILGRLEYGLEKRLDGDAARVLIHLHHHGWHQVEGLMHLREFLQDFHHAVVVFHGVQARPGEMVLSRDQVLVEGLMHVPQEAEVDSRHVKDRYDGSRVSSSKITPHRRRRGCSPDGGPQYVVQLVVVDTVLRAEIHTRGARGRGGLYRVAVI